MATGDGMPSAGKGRRFAAIPSGDARPGRTISSVSAESAYLFRHALVRDAAYQLQLPRDRAQLHGAALEAMETLAGGRPPAPPALDDPHPPRFERHPTDAFASELALHAEAAVALDSSESSAYRAALPIYLGRAAFLAEFTSRRETSELWLRWAKLLAGASRGEALRRASKAEAMRGRVAEAETLLEEATRLLGRGGGRLVGTARNDMATLYFETGRIREAERAFGEALSIHREAGNREGEGMSLGGLAWLVQQLGRLEEAERFNREALAIFRELGRRRSEGGVLANVGVVHFLAGRLDEAEATLEQALAIHRECGDRRSEGSTMSDLGCVLAGKGRAAQAERIWESALAIHREIGNRRDEGAVLANLANLYWIGGRDEEAERTCGSAFSAHLETGDRRRQSSTLAELATMYRESSRFGQADETIQQALRIDREMGDLAAEGGHICEWALCRLAEGRALEARDLARRGLALLASARARHAAETMREKLRAAGERAGVPGLCEP